MLPCVSQKLRPASAVSSLDGHRAGPVDRGKSTDLLKVLLFIRRRAAANPVAFNQGGPDIDAMRRLLRHQPWAFSAL